MLRRLHLEEASHALRLRAPSKEGENQENQGESELAVEFSRLLEQVQGPIAAAHDEVMALGLALAQAIPMIQQTKQEDLKKDIGDSLQSNDQDTGSQEADVTFDQGQDADTAMRYALESRDSRGAQGPQRREAEASQDSSEETENSKQDKASDVALQLNLGPELLADDEQVSQESGDEVQVQVVDSSAVSLDAELEVAVAQLQGTDDGGEVQEGIRETEIKGILQEVKITLDSQQLQDNQKDDDGGAAQDFVSSSEVMANADDAATRQVKATGGKSSAEEAQAAEATAASQSSPQEAVHEADKRGPQEAKQLLGEAKPAADQQRVQRQREAASKLVQSIKVETDHGLGQTSNEPAKAASASVDAAFQITLLRQAFENLRAHRAEGNEAKLRTTAPQVVATGSVSEAKAAVHEPSARGSKQLSHSHTRRMLERVESTLKEAARSRDGKTISLRLDPANLGRVKVDVSLREGSLHARISPENKQVLSALREHAHELQAALRKLGLNVDSVSVTVSSEAGQDLSEFGRELNNGKSFQDERNNLPNDGRQVAETTIGNELAEPSAVGSKSAETAGPDHWVA